MASETNAPAFLTQRIGVSHPGGSAGCGCVETTSVVSDTGGVTSNVTGDAGNYVLGKTIAGGSDEVGKWLMETPVPRVSMRSSCQGIRIAIHVDHELLIDLDTTGRRLTHAKSVDPHIRTLGLISLAIALAPQRGGAAQDGLR